MSKSKIMVFRNGGRLAGAEKWKCMGEEIEIVSEYTYIYIWHEHTKSGKT